MSNGARLVWYLVALVAFLVACLIEIAQSKRVTPVALIAAGLAALTVIPFWAAVEAAQKVVDRVFAIMEDGPMEGLVEELSIGDQLLQLTFGGKTYLYRRVGWGRSDTNHRIAHFTFVKVV